MILQRRQNLLTVLAIFHVDQIENDDSAEISQTNLTRNLLDCFHVRLRDRVLESGISLSNEFAGVDVDSNERLRLVDDEISSRLQPNSRLQSFLDFILNTVSFENRFVACIQLHTIHHFRLDPAHELDCA